MRITRSWYGIAESRAWRRPQFVTSGPILDGDPPFRPTNRVVATPEEAIAELDRQHEAGYDLLKLYDNVDPVVYEALVRRTHEHGMSVAGHVPTPVGLDRMLHLNGQSSIEHIEEHPVRVKVDRADGLG